MDPKAEDPSIWPSHRVGEPHWPARVSVEDMRDVPNLVRSIAHLIGCLQEAGAKLCAEAAEDPW